MDISVIRKRLDSMLNFHQSEHDRDIARMQAFQEELEKLPDEGCGNVYFNFDSASVQYFPESEEESTELAREIRGILRVPSVRTPTKDGAISWELTKEVVAGTLTVSITRATLAPGCKLVPILETKTVFKMVCGDDAE